MEMHLFDDLLQALRAKGERVSAFGIDLGTSKSCFAVASFDPVADRLAVSCVPYRDPGERSASIAMPSVVAIEGDEVLVGRAAKREIGKPRRFLEKNIFVDTKNEMGLRYTYWKAPPAFQSPTDIASTIVSALLDRADQELLGGGTEVVVTVPASFHGTQREATRDAVQQVIGEEGIALLDEPYAALLSFAFRHPEAMKHREGQSLLVFDFGGGTCDVAIFRLYRPQNEPMRARLLGTSRYHRLGGGDIDRLIVHRHLMPMLLQQNQMRAADLDFRQRKVLVEPQLLPLAESLKIALCKRIEAARATGSEPADELDAMAQGEHRVEIGDLTCWLTDPALSLSQFRKLLAPMLSGTTAPHVDDYFRLASMFEPIRNALERAAMEPEEVDLVLFAGTSTLNPLVRDAIAKYLPSSKALIEADAIELQGAVACGAALQALSIAVSGKPIVEPVLSGRLALQTSSGALPLLEAGMALPVRSASPLLLTPPVSDATRPVEIAVEVVTDASRVVMRHLWELAPPVRKGEALHCTWSIDTDQMLELCLTRVEDAISGALEVRMEAPVTHIDQGHRQRCQMLEREERIRTGQVRPDELGRVYEAIGHDARKLGLPDKAAHMYNLAMQHGRPSAQLRNWRGLCFWDTQDLDSAIEEFRAASDEPAAMFNLALALRNTGQFDEARSVIDRRMMQDDDMPSRVLRADILAGQDRKDDARLQYRDALDVATPPEDLDDFELHWLVRAAEKSGDANRLAALRVEQRKRSQESESEPEGARVGLLPEVLRN